MSGKTPTKKAKFAKKVDVKTALNDFMKDRTEFKTSRIPITCEWEKCKNGHYGLARASCGFLQWTELDGALTEEEKTDLSQIICHMVMEYNEEGNDLRQLNADQGSRFGMLIQPVDRSEMPFNVRIECNLSCLKRNEIFLMSTIIKKVEVEDESDCDEPV